MMKNLCSLFVLVPSLVLAAIACDDSKSNAPTNTDGGLTEAGSNNTDGGDSGNANAGSLPFTPSNFDLSGLDLSKAGDVILTGSNCLIEPSSTDPAFLCADDTKYVMKTVTRPDQSKMVVYVVKSLRIEANTILEARAGSAGDADLPFAIVALDSMTILGSIKVEPGAAGGGTNGLAEHTGMGPGGGISGPGASAKAGGGGASFCGIGGVGSAQTGGTPFGKSSAYGTPELVPLVAGSQGGSGLITSGSGGGAFQLVAGKSIEIQASSFLAAPGQGGYQGGAASGSQEASGGGSGGAILIEAPTVTVAGILTANGGGGGADAKNGGATGDDGHVSDAMVALGGSKPDSAATDHGGNGGAGDTKDGTDGVSDPAESGSAGGGGAGRIRINTTSGAATISGSTSPSATSGCFTQGKL